MSREGTLVSERAVSRVVGYIVWVRGPRGPELQKWREPPPDLSGYWAKRVIGSPIPVGRDMYSRSISELMRLFPAPNIWEHD